MNDWIDPKQRELFPKEVYRKAIEMYRNDHESFLVTPSSISEVNHFSLALHKAKSGAKLLGLLQLTAAIEQCEKTPNDTDIRKTLGQAYKESMYFVEAFLKE